MAMSPTVTVWIPSYNHSAWLPAAIESVLGQTFADLELVIVDDGSSDGSLAVAEGYAGGRVRVLTHPGHENRGVSATANRAIAEARGRLLLGLASDDVLYPDAIAREVAFLDRNPGAGCVYGYAHMIDEAGSRIPDMRTFGIDLTGGGRTLERLVQGNTIPSMTALFRRTALERAGPFDETVVYSDWELFIRVAAHAEIAFLPRALAMFRVHGTNLSARATREVNLARAMEVTRAVRAKADAVGGGLKEPRVRAMLELQTGFLAFADGDERAAAASMRSAFATDPSLAADPGRLADWLWGRLLDGLLPPAGSDFPDWVESTVLPLMERRAAGALRRQLAAAHVGESAIQRATGGQWGGALGAAFALLVRSPRRALDRRLAAVLLDSIADGAAARLVRATKRRVLSHR